MKNSNKIESFILREIKDLGYSVENNEVRTVLESSIEFAEIATKKELREYIEQSLELIPSSLLQGDVK